MSLSTSPQEAVCVSQSGQFHILECTPNPQVHTIHFSDHFPPTRIGHALHGTYFLGCTQGARLVLSKENTLSGHNHLAFYPSNQKKDSTVVLAANQNYRGSTILDHDVVPHCRC